MKFEYKRIPIDHAAIYRPIVPVEIRAGKKAIRYEVLIDSGADYNIFDGEIAEALGLDLESGEEVPIGGVTGHKISCYKHDVKILIGGWEHSCKSLFSRGLGPKGYGVVGQVGFFDHYQVKFDYAKAGIELIRR